MKALAVFLTVLLVLWAFTAVGIFVFANYQYSNQIESYWDLADRASTIEKKCEYIDKFVRALESAQLDDHNAIFLKTPENSLEQNMLALKSLQSRLHEIRGMNPTSFEYQQAIYQITQQEQGEAHNMTAVLKGCWWKHHHFFLWDWIASVQVIFLFVVAIVVLVIYAVAWDCNL